MATSVAPAPASAPSTSAPVSAPAASSPVSAPSPAPAAPSTPAPTVENAGNISEAWGRAVAAVPLEDKAVDAEPAPADVDTAEVPAVVEAAQETPAEVIDPTATEPEATPVVTTETDPEFSLQENGFDPKELNDFFKQDPAVQKFLDEHPAEKNKFYAMARRDSETRAIRQITPTLEVAQEMQRGHSLYSDFDTKFLSATTPEGTKAFMDRWVQEAMIVGDDGQPLKGADGKYQIHPALTNIMDTIHGNRSNWLVSQMQSSGKVPAKLADNAIAVADFFAKSGDERVQAAASILKEALSPHSSAQGDVPDELKPFSDSLKAKEKELADKQAALDRTQSESETTARTESLRRAETKAAETCLATVKPILAKAGLTKFETDAALTKIGNMVDEQLKANGTYQTIYNTIEARPVSDAREKALTRHVLTYTQEILGDIVSQVAREATEGKLGRQDATQDKVAKQAAASRMDPQGTSVGSSSTQPQTAEQLEAAIVKEYQDSHGTAPDRRYITEALWKRMAQGSARRTA